MTKLVFPTTECLLDQLKLPHPESHKRLHYVITGDEHWLSKTGFPLLTFPGILPWADKIVMTRDALQRERVSIPFITEFAKKLVSGTQVDIDEATKFLWIVKHLLYPMVALRDRLVTGDRLDLLNLINDRFMTNHGIAPETYIYRMRMYIMDNNIQTISRAVLPVDRSDAAILMKGSSPHHLTLLALACDAILGDN